MRWISLTCVACLSAAFATPVAVAQPAATPVQRVLYGMGAASSDDVWAAGADGSRTLIRHWDGSSWSDVTSPSPSRSPCLFDGVSARAKDDAWAVGYVNNGPAGSVTLIAHWDGHSWTTTPSPNPSHDNSLYGVAAVAADDAWAVGAGGKAALVLHWDGTSWRRVSTPATSGRARLSAITAVSPTNVWAAGEVGSKTLIEHWNGTAWKRVKSPNPKSSNYLDGISAAAANNIWAVGSSNTGSLTLILHWNGQRWSAQSSQNPGSNDQLFAVSAASAKNVWAVGDACCTSGGGAKTLTEHWNGHRWKLISSPNPSSSGDILAGVAAIRGGPVRAVGNTGQSDGGAAVLSLHWTGRAWAQP